MKFNFFLLIIFLFFASASDAQTKPAANSEKTDSSSYIKGNFTDDYGIRYSISDSIWLQQPGIKYHILKWNKTQQYLVARNDSKNPTDTGLYTRIDYMPFSDMQPYVWGFCYTVYNAANETAAEEALTADKKNPKKGCNHFPFSRMKKEL